MPTGLGATASRSGRAGMAAAQASHLRGSLLAILVLLVAGAAGYLALLRSLPPLKVRSCAGLLQRACKFGERL